jgi:nitrate reductase assembly molybdenum cofactor insertion protein NarJ
MRRLLLFACTLAGCAQGPEADLASVGQARSLAAEWALVNEQADRGHLTETYVRTMHASVREQLQTTAQALTEPQSDYGREIASLLREPDNAAPQTLRAHADRLRQVENRLESA